MTSAPARLLCALGLAAALGLTVAPAAAQTTCIDDTQIVDVIQRIQTIPPSGFDDPPAMTTPDAPTDATLDEPNGFNTESLAHGAWAVVRGGRVRGGDPVAERTVFVGRVYVTRTGDDGPFSVDSSFRGASTRSSLALRALVGQLLLFQLTGDRATVCHDGDAGLTLVRRTLPPLPAAE